MYGKQTVTENIIRRCLNSYFFFIRSDEGTRIVFDTVLTAGPSTVVVAAAAVVVAAATATTTTVAAAVVVVNVAAAVGYI